MLGSGGVRLHDRCCLSPLPCLLRLLTAVQLEGVKLRSLEEYEKRLYSPFDSEEEVGPSFYFVSLVFCLLSFVLVALAFANMEVGAFWFYFFFSCLFPSLGDCSPPTWGSFGG